MCVGSMQIFMLFRIRDLSLSGFRYHRDPGTHPPGMLRGDCNCIHMGHMAPGSVPHPLWALSRLLPSPWVSVFASVNGSDLGTPNLIPSSQRGALGWGMSEGRSREGLEPLGSEERNSGSNPSSSTSWPVT